MAKFTAKQASTIAITAALYTIFFGLSFTLSFVISVPSFLLLYLPIILLGVFPIWFGWEGLVGSMIGAFVGGYFFEPALGYFAWIESVCTLIIYGLTWMLVPRNAAQEKNPKKLALLFGVYALTLLAGLAYILWQNVALGFLPVDIALILFAPTYGLNLVIELIAAPVLLRTLSPKLKTWGLYSGNLREWLSRRATTKG